GGKWALWTGSLCIFLALACFFAYSWASLPPAPPWAQVTMGFIGGLALIGGGGFLRNRTKRYFSEGLSGAGLALCYLSLWAGSQHFAVLSHLQSFVGMALLTALGVGLALRYDAPSLSVLSTLGGFLTPVLLNNGGGSGSVAPFLTYVALLNAGILAVSLGKRWRSLIWLSFSCSLLLIGGWFTGVDIDAVRVTVLGFFTLYFLQYIAAATFYSLIRREETASEDLLLLFATTSLYALVGYRTASPLVGDIHSAFPLALAAFFGLLNLAITRIAPTNKSLRYSAGGLALFGITIAIPLQFQQSAFTIGWITEAAVLLFLAGQLDSPLLRRAGQIVWALTWFPLLRDFSDPHPGHLGIFSANALPVGVCVMTTSFIAWNARRFQGTPKKDEVEPLYAIYSVLGGAWWLAQEIYHYVESNHAGPSDNWAQGAYFLIGSVLAIYATGVFGIGIKLRHEVVRASALALTGTVALMAAFHLYANSFLPTAAKVAMHWPVSLLSYVCISFALIAMTVMLRSKHEALTPLEKECTNAWQSGTILFILWG
ncbi:DUF2339 domain-containing protein, partial [bacterium]